MASSLPYSGGQGDNNNVAGEETFEKGRKNYAKNLMPVNVRTLLQHQHNQGPGEPLVVHGQAVGMVSLVGQIRQVTKGTVSLSYLLEDETGRIEAVHYIDEDNKIQPPIVNTFVQIIGILKSGQERSMVTVYKLLPVRNMHQVTAHKLEIIVTPLRIAKQQEMASMAALATLNGFHPGFGNNVRKWPGSNETFGRSLDHRNSLMNNNRLSSRDFRPHFNQGPAPQNSKSFPLQNQNHQTSNNFNCFSEPRDPDMKKVLASIKNCPAAIGLSKLDLLKFHRHSISEKKMSEVIDYLTSEGHIYNTIDEHHFKATDA